MCNQILSTFTYNRTTKEYEAVTPAGHIFATFPSGKEGRQAAREAVIKNDAPRVYETALFLHRDLLRKRADLRERMWAGAELAAAGQVFAAHPLNFHASVFAHVASSQPGKFYEVRRYTDRPDAPAYVCTCHDFMSYAAPVLEKQALCKHIFAIKIMLLAARPFSIFTANPKALFPYLEETTAAFEVVGVFNNSIYTAYPTATHRTAVIGEVVSMDGRFLRLIGSGQKMSSFDVTEEIKQPPPAAPLYFSPSYEAHCAANYEPPKPAAENHELTAALKNMAAAAHKNYPSKDRMTDLKAKELNDLLFG